MVKVIVECPVPRKRIECPNCHSILEYGNADLMEDWRESSQFGNAVYIPTYITCPVCGVKVKAYTVTSESE